MDLQVPMLVHCSERENLTVRYDRSRVLSFQENVIRISSPRPTSGGYGYCYPTKYSRLGNTLRLKSGMKQNKTILSRLVRV